ncbi:MAG: response regulator [Puniceicoccaceae bacterium]|nr:MAG: response regulator [Puniceicoccaceae bacterium]
MRPTVKPLVLLVDDEPGLREATGEILLALGYEVLTAENGAEGLATVRRLQGRIDIVIMDFCMPVMDGLEAFYRIRGEFPDLPVIFSSGYCDDAILMDEADRFLEFLPKPYSLSALRTALDRVRQGSCPAVGT